MVPSAFLLSPQTPSQPEPNSGKTRSLREPYAVTPCAQHAHFPKPEILALHVHVWLSPGSPPVPVAEPSVLHYFQQSHCPPLTEWRQSPTAQSSTAPVARHLSVAFNVLRSTTSFFSCLGHRILKEKSEQFLPRTV